MFTRVLSFDEAAGRSNIVRRTLEREIAKGEGPAIIHLGKRRRGILEADLEAWLLSRRRAPPGEDAKASTAQEAGGQ
jgi:predicted DNA-binding transcriptional regulator AlpA